MVPVAIGVFLLDPLGGPEAVSRAHRFWFLMLPISTAVSGAAVVAMAVANRARAYRTIATLQFSAATASACASLVFGLAGMGGDGLLLAYGVGQAVFLGFAIAIVRRGRLLRHPISTGSLLRLAQQHRGYPVFTMPTALLQTLMLQLPLFVFIYLQEAALLGALGRAQSLLILPILLISNAISRVYFQRATEDYNRTGTCRPIFVKTVPLILVVAAPFLMLFGLFGPGVFTLYLGANWTEAGQIARILAPVFFLQMFANVLGASALFAGNQLLSLKLQVLGGVLTVAGCGLPLAIGLAPTDAITGWALAISVFYLLRIWLGWELSSKDNRWTSPARMDRRAGARNALGGRTCCGRAGERA